MSRSRGFSLMLVLLVASIVLFVGSAIGVMSSLSLNTAARLLSRARAEALANAVTAQTCFELDRRVWSKPYPHCPIPYPNMAYEPGAVRKRFETMPLFPDTTQHVLDGTMQAWVDFRSDTYFSVDNLNQDSRASGWLDYRTSRMTVPPFSLSLIINTGVGDSREGLRDVRHFEAQINRVWPYALYSVSAPLNIGQCTTITGHTYGCSGDVIVGEMDTPPVRLVGDVRVGGIRTSETKPVFVVPGQGQVLGKIRYKFPPMQGPDPGTTDDPMSVLGLPLTVADSAVTTFVPSYDAVTGVSVAVPAPPRGPPIPDGYTWIHEDPNKVVDARTLEGLLLSLAQILKLPIPQAVKDAYRQNIQYVMSHSMLNNVKFWRTTTPRDPKNPYEQVTDLTSYAGLIRVRVSADGSTRPEDGIAPEDDSAPRLLVSNLSLTGGRWGTGPLLNHFTVQRGATWRKVPVGDGKHAWQCVGGSPSELYTGDSNGPARILMDDAVLYVAGDLDVSGLSGKNSALIVNGSLYIAGGSLDAGDKGMLIWARNVTLEATGDFRGIIVARDSITFKPLHGTDVLTIRGAVVVGGGDSAPSSVVDSTTLTVDNLYTRALNRLGTGRTLIFQEIP